MNNPEATMHDSETTTGFEALDKAVHAAAIAISLARRVPAPLRPIGEQMIRAASSEPANIAEGSGRCGRD
jgi:four helix bundle protein